MLAIISVAHGAVSSCWSPICSVYVVWLGLFSTQCNQILQSTKIIKHLFFKSTVINYKAGQDEDEDLCYAYACAYVICISTEAGGIMNQLQKYVL